MSDVTAPPAWQTEEEIGAPVRRVAVQREWCLARHVVIFCRKAVACEYEFQCHDRGKARSQYEHAHEARRGCQAGWPDVELALDGGKTFRCELKRPGRTPDPKKDGKQIWLAARLATLGHPTNWANSVEMFATAAHLAGVPLVPNWERMAQLQDEYVAAEVRREEHKAAQKRLGVFRPKPRARRATPGQVARFRRAGGMV